MKKSGKAADKKVVKDAELERKSKRPRGGTRIQKMAEQMFRESFMIYAEALRR